MLHDRPYMREPSFRPRWTLTNRLIAVLIGIFLVQCVLEVLLGVPISRYLALSLDGMAHGYVWQLLTFQFLHAAPWPFHVLFNCLFLYFFGNALEDAYG